MDNKALNRPWRSKEDAEVGLALVESLIGSECSNGQPLASYLADLRNVERSSCTTFWRAGTFAYRCRDCQVTESSAICVECFKAGPHVNHDYIMYRSVAGGCCDCGDPASLKEEGFCSLHAHQEETAEVLPRGTRRLFQKIVSLLLARLLGMIGLLGIGATDPKDGAELVLKWLQQVCSVRALREIVCQEMVRTPLGETSKSELSPLAPLSILLKSFVTVPSIAEEETTLFLLMLYSHSFKESFSRALLCNYADWVLSNVHNEDTFRLLDLCLDRVMVQLINVESITVELVRRGALLDCFLNVLGELLKKAIDPNTSKLNANHPVIANRLYTRPWSDLRLIISHNEVGLHILNERQDLLVQYLRMLESLQYMHPVRQLAFRDLDEDGGWMHAVALEAVMTTIASQLVTGCCSLLGTPNTSDRIKQSVVVSLISAAGQTLNMLRAYYDKDYVSMDLDSKLGFMGVSMSLHIPLHRAFSMILVKLLQCATAAPAGMQYIVHEGLKSLVSYHYTNPDQPKSQAGQLMEYPLRIIFWMAEIRGRQWRHQGEDLARLERVYYSSYWHEQAFDMDVLLLQFCISTAGPHIDIVLLQILDRYKVADLLKKERRPSLEATSPDTQIRSATLSRMLEVLRLILMLVRERRYVAMAEMELLRYEVIHWLCFKDLTYTALTSCLAQSLANHPQLEEVLRDVATYIVPKLQERGFYRLKPECWREFDALFSHFSKGDLEEALSRAVDIGKVGSYWRLPPLRPNQPPFNTLCNVLHSKIFHQFLYVALDQSLQLLESETNSTMGEALGTVVCQLIATAALDDRQGPHNRRYQPDPRNPFSDFWPFIVFPSNDIAANVRANCKPEGDSRSMLDLFTEIRKGTDSARLLDCIQYVLETTHALSVGSGKQEGSPSEAASSPPDAESFRQLKKQRQAAILADFAARQKAFLNESPSAAEDGETGTTAEGISREGETLHLEAGPSSRSRSQECAFCLGDHEMNGSPMGWIAFIQISNIPAIAYRQLRTVQGLNEAASCVEDAQSSSQIVCSVPVVEKDGSEEGTRGVHAYESGEHVACCGHQMHLECYQRYLRSLSESHNGGRMYEGLGIINLAKFEFLCPLCRRVANFLLPDILIEPPRASANPDTSDAPPPPRSVASFFEILKGLSQTASHLSVEYWRTRYRKYESWCQLLVVQCRAQWQEIQTEPLTPETNGQDFWRKLWMILAANVVQCEVETRGSTAGTQGGSTSTLPGGGSAGDVLNDLLQQWGGESAHWRAMRAVAKLAVLSTTFDDDPLDQRAHSLADWENEFTELAGGTLENGGMETETEAVALSSQGEGTAAEKMVTDGGRPLVSTVQHSITEKSPQTRARLPGKVRTANEAGGQSALEAIEGKAVPAGESPSGQETKPAEEGAVGEEKQIAEEGDDSAMDTRTETVDEEKDDSALMQDPFAILIFLFMTHVGFPSHSGALAMVNAAYHIAAAQAFLAADGLKRPTADGSDLSDVALVSVMQAALVPFLRRAGILVHVVSGRLPPASDLGDSDGDLMDFTYWQRYLGLPPIPAVVQTMGLQTVAGIALHRKRPLPRQLLLSGRAQLKLLDLPDVFQELLLAEMNRTCNRCRKVPKEAALCLLCGTLVCVKSPCCHVDNRGECFVHAAECGMGVGIYLLLRSTQMLILRGERACMAPSIYLDAHGEEDAFLKRGRPLRLSRLRYDEIERLWLTAGLDHNSQVLHSSHLSAESL